MRLPLSHTQPDDHYQATDDVQTQQPRLTQPNEQHQGRQQASAELSPRARILSFDSNDRGSDEESGSQEEACEYLLAKEWLAILTPDGIDCEETQEAENQQVRIWPLEHPEDELSNLGEVHRRLAH
jgi:hypothetical protein